MTSPPAENLPDEARLALAHTQPVLTDALRILLEFDQRIARIVAATTEPMLGQMRIAWWRDTLGMPANDRPRGDAVLDGLGQFWSGVEAPLIAVVDGWEHMLSDPPLTREAALAFAQGRGEGMAGLSQIVGSPVRIAGDLRVCGQIWALADAASHIAQGAERQTLLNLARELPRPSNTLPSPFRGVAILYALAERSLQADGAPLMAGRGAALVALRAGLFGR
jgi:phytoene synthase